MTLRDRFAMAAIQGFCSQPDCESWSHEHHAMAAYQQADAMIAERDKSLAENTQSIKQALVDEINKKYPGNHPSTESSASLLIFQLSTGLPF